MPVANMDGSKFVAQSARFRRQGLLAQKDE
jgi:hypothetical protein